MLVFVEMKVWQKYTFDIFITINVVMSDAGYDV